MVRVKVCGITNADDAMAAVEAGADALGFVFFRESPRAVDPSTAAEIVAGLPPFVSAAGVFVNEDPVRIAEVVRETGIDCVQLHGDESPETCGSFLRAVKAIRVMSLESLEPLSRYQDAVSAFLLDAYAPGALGGTGQVFNWDIAVEAKRFGRIILAGGLTPDNVADAVKRVMPYAVDVSSGVEASKGKKDHQKMKLFIERAKTA